MKEKEIIDVYVDVQNGKTVCICELHNKGCDKNCQKDIVERDVFRDWQSTLFRNRYGQ